MGNLFDQFDQKPEAGGNVFDQFDAPKRKVGAGEAFGRGAGGGLAGTGNTLALAAAAPAIAVDAIGNLFRKTPSTAAQDFVFRNVVDPTKNAVDAYALKPNEEMGTAATVANVGGNLAAMLPTMIASGGAGAGVLAKLPAIAQNLVKGAAVAQPAFAVPATVQRAQQLLEAGVPGEVVLPASASNWAMNTAAGAMPLAKAGGVLMRGGTGAGLNFATGAAQRGAEGAILGEEYASQAQPAFGLKENLLDAGIGGLMATFLGPRAPRPLPAPVPRPEPTLAPIEPPAPPAPPPAPKMDLVPKNAEPVTQHAPDPTKAPVAPDWKLEGDPEPPAPAKPTVADQVAQDTLAEAVRQRIEAEEAFKLAQRRQDQADRGLRQEGEIAPDYQGDGAAFKPGEEPTRTITLLDRQNPVMVDRVEGDKAHVVYQNEDGTYTREVVDAKRLSTVEQPVAQRRAQDFRERSSEPPRGVGVDTMASERMPRRSTDRIAGDEAGGRAEPYDPTVREPREPSGQADVVPREPQGGALARRGDVRGEVHENRPSPEAPPAPENRLPDNGRRSLEAPEPQGRLPGPDSAHPDGERVVVDSEGHARPDNETYGQKNARDEAARRDQIVSDYSRNELGNTGVRNAGTDSASAARTGPGDAAAGNRGNDGAANGQSRTPTGDANAVRQPEGAGNGRTAASGAAGNGGAARVAEPREVPRLQVDYEKAVTQAKRVATRLRNLLSEPNQEAVKAKVAGARDQLSKLRATIAGLAERLTPERIPQKERKDDSILTAVRQAGGVTKELASDLKLDKPDVKLRGGKIKSEDALVDALYDKGWLTHDEYLSPDAYKIATEKIGREVRGESPDGRTETDLERQARAREDEAIQRQADEYGIDTRDMTRDQVLDSIAREQEKAATAREVDEANAAAEDARREAMDGRTIDEILDEVGVTDRDIENAKWEREGVAESQAVADEAARSRVGGDEAAPVQEQPRPAQQANADEVRPESQSGNAADRAGPGQGVGGDGAGRSVGGEAGGESGAPRKRDEAAYRLNALPLDAAWRGVRDVLRHLFSDDSASAPLNKALSDLWHAAKDSDKGTLLARTFGTLFWSDASVVKSVASALKSPTLDKVWRQFADMGGTEKVHGETFEQEVTARMQRNSNEVAGLMHGLSPDQVKQVKALLENRRGINPNAGGAHKAAAAIAKLLDAERDWLRANGVQIGDTKDYFPRVYLPGEIQRRAADFKRAAEAAYREMGVDDPARAAEEWYHAITMKGDGVPDVPFADLSSDVPTKNFAKTREIPADIAKRAGLDAFTDHDVTSVLTSYFRRTAKRGAFEARFGGVDEAGRGNAKWREMRKALEAEGHADMIGWAESKILSMSGQASTSTPPWARDTAALARAVTVAVFLRRAVISSLTEPLQVANRTAALGATGAVKNAAIMYARGAERLARRLTGLGQGASEAERFRVAELLGTVLSRHLEGGVASMRLDGDPVLNERGSVVSRAADKVSQAAMTASGLHDWTNANMVDSTIMGMDFVKQMAADSGSNRKLAAYELDRLGIPEADHAAFSKYAAGVKSADQLVADMKAGNKQAAQYVAAIDKFTRQVIMRPTAADKPMLAKHPVAQMMYGLQSWMYSYWYNVQKANINQIREAVHGKGYTAGDRATMALAPLLYTAAVVTMSSTLVNTMRDLVSGRQKDREREERNKKAHIGGMGVETIRALSQAQMFGLADPFVNSLTSARYDKQPGSELGGPLLGRAAKAGMMSTKLLTDKNSPNTNTPERQAAEANYNLVVDPLLAIAAASMPMPAASAATFLSQRDELRQAFVDKVAGPKRQKSVGDRYQ